MIQTRCIISLNRDDAGHVDGCDIFANEGIGDVDVLREGLGKHEELISRIDDTVVIFGAYYRGYHKVQGFPR